jgi:hypothetical protein
MDIGHSCTIMIFVPPKFTLQQRLLRCPAEGNSLRNTEKILFGKTENKLSDQILSHK